MLAPSERTPPDRDLRLALGLFIVLLGVHLWMALTGWSHGWLPGHEFRQTQTAITTLFVQRDHNFSLAYPTPILGKPWSLPMEFPLYEWTVAALSTATGLALAPAARTVSLTCFYLTLPALFLLLGRVGLRPSRRLLAIGMVLVSPLYIFYSRAFLIESMALLLGVWFIAAFVEAMTTRQTRWLVAANLAGIAAGTVKVTTFSIYLLPAVFCALFFLRRAWPHAGESLRPVLAIAARALGCVLAPLSAAALWVIYSDHVKAQNPGADFLLSTALEQFNFGPWSMRFTAEFWQGLLSHWRESLLPTPVIAAVAGIGLIFGGQRRALIAGLLAMFLCIQLVFSKLYLIHDYYLYANGLLLMLALGVTLDALLDRLAGGRVLRWLPWLLVLGLGVTQFQTYRKTLLPLQQLDIPGGGEHTRLLHQFTSPDDVLVIVGNDWSSVIPYYAGRRALMLPIWREENEAYLTAALAALTEERIGAVAINRKSRSGPRILDALERRHGIVRAPVFTTNDDLVFYFHEDNYLAVTEFLHRAPDVQLNGIAISPRTAPTTVFNSLKEIVVDQLPDRGVFDAMSPAPRLLRTPLDRPLSTTVDNQRHLNAHAPTELIFDLTAGVHRLEAQFGLEAETYSQPEGSNTDGVDFVVLLRRPLHADKLLKEVYLDPRARPADRGLHRLQLDFKATADTQLVLQTGPGRANNTAYDWAYWGKVEIH